jgi:hypothetical protein
MPADAKTFHRKWGHLAQPHVRALAWLLDSPDLLDPASPHWQGRIATLGCVTPAVANWLADLDADPAPLDAALGNRYYSRLGLYAEKLMAFYFDQQGRLAAHGLQVRDGKHGTIGEFDFLLRDEGSSQLRHIEFATKFYLLDGSRAPLAGAPDHDRLVGPNLADTLGLKMRKIFNAQLQLSRHPAAQQAVPAPVGAAQALVKGWLFYHATEPAPHIEGISPDHCRGHWRSLGEQAAAVGEQFIVMPRLQWLAPLRTPARTVTAEGQQAASPVQLPPVPAALARGALLDILAEKFGADPSPVLVATVREEGGWLEETERGFVVPDDWRARAQARRSGGTLPA